MSHTRNSQKKADAKSPIQEEQPKKKKSRPAASSPQQGPRKKTKKIEEISESESDTKLSPELAALFPMAAPNEEREFSGRDFDYLNINEHYRYLNNSKKVGHAVLVKDDKGEEVALQYNIPETENGSSPEIRPLINIEAIDRYGLRRYRAMTPDNSTPMFATRYIDAEITDGDDVDALQIACFSPKKNGEPFWGSNEKEIPLFRGDLDKETKRELLKELQEIPEHTKCGNELIIDPESVRVRDQIKKRNPDQNTVMGQSAKDAYADFLDEMTGELNPEMKTRLKRAIEAPLRDMFYGNYRPEWLHGEGFSLTPMTKDPQRQDNLGAAPKWANTEMMVLERIAKWFVLNRPNSLVKIKPFFEMLLGSELIKKINFEVSIEENDRRIRFPQELNPFTKNHIFRKASDLAQSTAIAYQLLQGNEPADIQNVKDSKAKENISLAGNSNVTKKEDSTMRSFKSIKAKKKENTTNPIYPTSFNKEKSLVQILTTFQEFDYDDPWRSPYTNSCSGSGVVFEHQGQKYILTNAHCVLNSTRVNIRLANNTETFEAEKVIIDPQCDLAIYKVDDPEFLAQAEPAVFGDMVSLQDEVQTIGFPMGGEEISITRGIVNRIEVQSYVTSDLGEHSMLQVQVDSAINPGNSGGPVFGSDDRVAGIAFQGISFAQSLGYMIPTPVVKHFIEEALEHKKYHGFPILPIEFHQLENDALREYYGLNPKQRIGIRIHRVDKLSDAYQNLKPNDILLEIDGHPVSNKGTVDIQDIGKCIDLIHLTQMKYIGDSVNLKILRKNAEKNRFDTLNLNIELDCTHRSSKAIQTENGKMGSYYFISGVSFVPLTTNYLEGRGSDLEECFIAEESCRLIDLPKTNPEQQIVAINHVINHKGTKGYDASINELVAKVNGKAINNMQDLIAAAEANTEKFHCIETKSKTTIILPKLTHSQHMAILKNDSIKQDRSDDYLAAAEIENTVSPSKSSTTILNVLTASNKKKPQKKVVLPVEESSSEDEATQHESLAKVFGNGPTPGQKRFMQTVAKIEERALEEEDEDDYEIDMTLEEDEEDIEASSEMSVEEEIVSRKNRSLTKIPNRNRLFQNKRDTNREEEVVHSHQKRQRLR